MGSIRPHSSRRKPVQVWKVYHENETGSNQELFWYRKDAEAYIIDHANMFAADDDEPREFKGIEAALNYLNDSYDTWNYEQVTVNGNPLPV